MVTKLQTSVCERPEEIRTKKNITNNHGSILRVRVCVCATTMESSLRQPYNQLPVEDSNDDDPVLNDDNAAVEEDGLEDVAIGSQQDGGDEQPKQQPGATQNDPTAFEIDGNNDDDDDRNDFDGAPSAQSSLTRTLRDDRLCSLTEPWFVSCIITILFIVPTLWLAVWFLRDLIGKMWLALPFCIHATIAVWCTRCLIPAESLRSKRPSFLFRAIPSVLDIWLLGSFYSKIWYGLEMYLFTDVDGTAVREYRGTIVLLSALRFYGLGIAILRAFVDGVALLFLFYTERLGCRLPRFAAILVDRIESVGTASISTEQRRSIRLGLRKILLVILVIASLLLVWSIDSALVGWITWSPPRHEGPSCDPLDDTECAFPFPSSFLAAL